MSRITSLDTVRGAAVMGILVMNSVSYALSNEAYFDISAAGIMFPTDWFFGGLGEIFADQKFMGLFSLLFGASMLLFLERVSKRSEHPVRLALWRNFLLFCIGLLHISLWEGDVLMLYAMCTPFLLLVRKCGARVLMILGTLCFVLSLGCTLYFGSTAEATQIRALWSSSPKAESELLGLVFLLGYFCRALGMMLIGMGLYNSGWLRTSISNAMIQKASISIGCGVLLAASGVACVVIKGFNAKSIVLGNAANDLATIPMVMGYLVLLIWWDQRSSSRWLLRVRALGQMALTNYLGQTVICLSLVAIIPKQWISRSGIWLAMLLLWWLQLRLSELWMARFRMGPLEWLWRCVTYFQIEPLRR